MHRLCYYPQQHVWQCWHGSHAPLSLKFSRQKTDRKTGHKSAGSFIKLCRESTLNVGVYTNVEMCVDPPSQHQHSNINGWCKVSHECRCTGMSRWSSESSSQREKDEENAYFWLRERGVPWQHKHTYSTYTAIYRDTSTWFSILWHSQGSVKRFSEWIQNSCTLPF